MADRVIDNPILNRPYDEPRGAAQAIEDGATLAACLAAPGSGIPEALRRYERLRIPRTSRLQAMSADNKTRFHLPDVPT